MGNPSPLVSWKTAGTANATVQLCLGFDAPAADVVFLQRPDEWADRLYDGGERE